LAATLARVAAFESGRRLCLLFEAGAVRYAVEATSVVEVAPPDLDGDSIRGFLELKDLSILLGGPAEVRPGTAVVLDVSPTLAVRVRAVIEVADVARDPIFKMPQGLPETLALIVRGAVLHLNRLYLELVADAVPRTAASWVPTPRAVFLVDEPPEQALIFESQGRQYGIPLPFVSQVVPGALGFCPLPFAGGPIAGLFPHHQVLWPIFSAAGLLGAQAQREELFLLTELAGQNVGLCASRVLGVQQGFTPTQARGEYVSRSGGAASLFLDFQRMFS
jgi:chemotaxis signal transduction protein